MGSHKRYVPVRMSPELLDKIQSYMEKNKIKDLSKSIRKLLEIGLSPTQAVYNGGEPLLNKKTQLQKPNNPRKFFHNEFGEKIPY